MKSNSIGTDLMMKAGECETKINKYRLGTEAKGSTGFRILKTLT